MNSKTYSTSEVAAKIGVSRQTLYSWIDAGLIDPPNSISAGHASIRVWTDTHVAAARRFKGTLKPGPRPKKSRPQKDARKSTSIR